MKKVSKRAMMCKAVMMCMVFASLSGCVSFESPSVVLGEGKIERTEGDSNKVAICVGLTAVDSRYYNGWAGDCPGCDVDAKGMYNLFVKNGYTSTLMLNSACTWDNVSNTILSNARKLKSGDKIVIMMSGHGGQIKDQNGDEVDGQDETICMWDGQVRDDDVLKMLKQFPDGLKIVMINDQCHSEGNYKTALRSFKQTVSLGYWGTQEGTVLIDKSGFNGRLIQFAGCREASYSYGATDGGTWTQSLLTVIEKDNTLSWIILFNKAKLIMPSNQTPVYMEEGEVGCFRDEAVLK